MAMAQLIAPALVNGNILVCSEGLSLGAGVVSRLADCVSAALNGETSYELSI